MKKGEWKSRALDAETRVGEFEEALRPLADEVYGVGVQWTSPGVLVSTYLSKRSRQPRRPLRIYGDYEPWRG